MWKKAPKEKKLRKRTVSLLKNSVWNSFQFLFVQINHLVSPLVKDRLQMGFTKQLMG